MLQETRKRNKFGFETPAQLADDLINEIVNHLPAKSNFGFKCVSKQWFSLNSEALKLKSRTSTMSGMFYTTEKAKRKRLSVEYARTQDEVGNEDATLSFLPEHRNVRIYSSCNGLLLLEGWDKHEYSIFLSDQTSCLYVCNPATRKWVKIPCDYTNKASFRYIYLDFNPLVSVHFNIITIRSYNPQSWAFGVFSSKTGEWKVSKVTNPMLAGYGFLNYSTSIFKGLIFSANQKSTHVSVFDMEGNFCRRMDLPGSSHEKNGSFFCQLGPSGGSPFQSGGSLHYYYISERKLYVWKLVGYETGPWLLRNSFRVAGPMRWVRDLEFHPHTDEVAFLRIKGRLHSYNIQTAQLIDLCSFHGPFLYSRYFPYSPCYLDGLANEAGTKLAKD